MKKIIFGRMYDTDTANYLGSRESRDLGPGDLYYVRENLYRKKTGEYFLYGEGGAGTIYATQRENGSSSGETIIPLDYGEARQWAERHMSPEQYAELFEVPEETEAMVRLTLPVVLLDRLKEEARKAGKSLSDYVAERLQGA